MGASFKNPYRKTFYLYGIGKSRSLMFFYHLFPIALQVNLVLKALVTNL